MVGEGDRETGMGIGGTSTGCPAWAGTGPAIVVGSIASIASSCGTSVGGAGVGAGVGEVCRSAVSRMVCRRNDSWHSFSAFTSSSSLSIRSAIACIRRSESCGAGPSVTGFDGPSGVVLALSSANVGTRKKVHQHPEWNFSDCQTYLSPRLNWPVPPMWAPSS
jgi:hypothetical protein